MKSRNSQRKRRQEKRLLPEQVAMRVVQALKLPACVDRVESEFQGDWNTLCIFVYLDVATSESDVDELKEMFSDRLERALESASTHIEWSVGFWKAEELLGSIESG